MEALDSQQYAALATRAAPNPSLSTGASAQATTKAPLVCLSTHGCPILWLPMCWGGCQPHGVGVLLCDKVRAKPLKRTPKARPADGHTLLTSSDDPGKSLGSC